VKSAATVLLAAIAIVCALAFAGCATPYPALTAAVGTGRAAIAGFEQYDHDHKRAILAAAAEKCNVAPFPAKCFLDALAPYAAKRDEVLSKIDALAPALTQAAAVAQQADADRSMTDALAAKLSALASEVLMAVARLRGAP